MYLIVVQNFNLNSLQRRLQNTKKQLPVHAATLLAVYNRIDSE